MHTIERILLATDGSDHALHAAAYAGMLSRATGALLDVIVVHSNDAVMLNALGPAVWPATVPYSAMSAEEIRAAVEQHATTELLPATVAACGAGAHIGAQAQRWGQPAECICAYAEDQGCDQIVLGTRGRTSFSKLLLGSVSVQVTSHAHCPVTLVR